MFLAIDPGETTGWATFDQHGNLLDLGQIKGFELFSDWLDYEIEKPSLIIYEEWVTNPNVPQGGSKQETSQVIGAIRAYARRNGIVVVAQRTSAKPVGYAFAGIKPLPKSRHSESHQYDAFAHGIYYLVKNKITKTALQKKLESREGD